MGRMMGFLFFMLFLAGIAFVTLKGRQQNPGDGNSQESTTTLPGSEWRPAMLAGESLPGDHELAIRFDDQGQVEGNGGCNRFFGGYSIAEQGIEIGPLASSRRACPEPVMKLETRFLRALELATRWQVESGNLELLDADDQMLGRFEARIVL